MTFCGDSGELGAGRLTSVQTFQLGLKVLHYNTAHFIPPTQPKTFRTHARHSGCGFLVRVEIHLCDKILIAAPCGYTGKNKGFSFINLKNIKYNFSPNKLRRKVIYIIVPRHVFK